MRDPTIYLSAVILVQFVLAAYLIASSFLGAFSQSRSGDEFHIYMHDYDGNLPDGAVCLFPLNINYQTSFVDIFILTDKSVG